MPPPLTRSGGPPSTAAVTGSTRTKTKSRKNAKKKTKKTRQPRPVSSGTTAGATEESDRAQFLHLSRLAKDLRDAAADYPGAQGALLEFLIKHWGQPRGPTQTPDYEDPPQSIEDPEGSIESGKYSAAEQVVNQALKFLVTIRSGMQAQLPVGILPNASFVYSSMQLALVSAPSGFFGFLTSMEALQNHLRQLFDDSKKGRKAYRDAQCFLTEMYGDFKRTLNHAKMRLGGEYAVELLFHPWEYKVMSADLDYFDPLGLLQSAIENSTAAHFKNLQKLQASASAQRVFASSAAPASLTGHGQARLPPPPPGLNVPKSGKHFFFHIRKTGRFPMKDSSCVLCGKGEEPGSQGHRAEVCGATDQEINNWVEHGIPAK